MKRIIIMVALLSLIVLSGCNESVSAYFDLGTCCEDKDWQAECDSICATSGIRILDYRHKNKVIFDDCNYICKCY